MWGAGGGGRSRGPDMYAVIILSLLPWLRLHGRSSSGKQMGWMEGEEDEEEEMEE